jgi:hypothetical protein
MILFLIAFSLTFSQFGLVYRAINRTNGGLTMAGKFELYKDKAGECRFRLKASNCRGILVSEGYKAKGSA